MVQSVRHRKRDDLSSVFLARALVASRNPATLPEALLRAWLQLVAGNALVVRHREDDWLFAILGQLKAQVCQGECKSAAKFYNFSCLGREHSLTPEASFF